MKTSNTFNSTLTINNNVNSNNSHKGGIMRIIKIQDAPMKRYNPCTLCGSNKHAAAIPNGEYGYIYTGVCLKCLRQEGEAHELIVTGRAEEKTVEKKHFCPECFSEVENEGDLCKKCYARMMSTKTTDRCPSCGSEHGAFSDYCPTCTSLADMEGLDPVDFQNGVVRLSSRLILEARRINMTISLYGFKAVDNFEWMCRDRDFRTLAFNATLYGRNMSEVLDNREFEVMTREDDDYEKVADDFDHVPLKVKGVTKDVYYMIKDMDEETALKYSGDDENFHYSSESNVYRFVSQEQRATNFDFYMRKIEEATDPATIEYLERIIRNGINNSIRKFETEAGEEIEAPMFFPTGKTGLVFEALRSIEAKEREDRFNYFMEKLSSANSLRELGKIAQEVYKKSQEFEHTFENAEGEMVTASMVFPKGGLAQFWDKYKELKAERLEKADEKIKEVETWVKQAASISLLLKAKKRIYELDLLSDHKKYLWRLCDQMIVAKRVA